MLNLLKKNRLLIKTVLLLGFISVFTTTDLIVKEIAQKNLKNKPEIVVIKDYWSYFYATNDDIGFSILQSLSKYFVPKQIKKEKYENEVLQELNSGYFRNFMNSYYTLDESSDQYVLNKDTDNYAKSEIMRLLGKSGQKTAKWLFLVMLQGLGTVIILIFYFNTKALNQLIPLALIISGALGNVIDRIFRGYVVDFINWHYKEIYYWPTFNFADVYTVIGAILLMIILFFFTKEETKKEETQE